VIAKKQGLKNLPHFEPHIVDEFRAAVVEPKNHLGRKMAALMPLKNDIQTARSNGWTYSDIASQLSKGAMVVDSTTIARFCRVHLAEKAAKKTSRKNGRSETAAASSSPSVPVAPTANVAGRVGVEETR
jgi:hypothetical protein